MLSDWMRGLLYAEKQQQQHGIKGAWDNWQREYMPGFENDFDVGIKDYLHNFRERENESTNQQVEEKIQFRHDSVLRLGNLLQKQGQSWHEVL